MNNSGDEENVRTWKMIFGDEHIIDFFQSASMSIKTRLAGQAKTKPKNKKRKAATTPPITEEVLQSSPPSTTPIDILTQALSSSAATPQPVIMIQLVLNVLLKRNFAPGKSMAADSSVPGKQ